MRYRATHNGIPFPFFSLKTVDCRALETYHLHRKNLRIKIRDLIECLVGIAVENSYDLAAWGAVLLIRERNCIQLRRKEQRSLNKAFDTDLQEKARVKCAYAKYREIWKRSPCFLPWFLVLSLLHGEKPIGITNINVYVLYLLHMWAELK